MLETTTDPTQPTQPAPDSWFDQNQPQITPTATTATGDPALTQAPGTTAVPPGWDSTQYLPTGFDANSTGYGSVTYGGDPRDYVQRLIAHFGLKGSQSDPAALNTIVHGLQGRGVNAQVAPAGSGGYVKGITIDGKFIKLVDGSNNWTWLEGGDASTGDGAGLAGLSNSALTAPFTEQFDFKPYEGLNPADIKPFMPKAPGFKSYAPPTEEELRSDPSYMFRQGQAGQGIERAAAANGTLLTGGTLKELSQRYSDLASEEYGNVDARKYRDWTAGYNRLSDEDRQAFDEWQTNYGNAVNRNATDYSRQLGQYNLRKQLFYEGEDRPYDKLYKLADLGRF